MARQCTDATCHRYDFRISAIRLVAVGERVAVTAQSSTSGHRRLLSQDQAFHLTTGHGLVIEDERPVAPEAVVVDTRTGYTWSSGADGEPFTEAGARVFAHSRNEGMTPEHQTYRVYTLTEA